MVRDMGTPFIRFLAHPSGAPFARFALTNFTHTDVGVWEAMAPHLPREAHLPYTPQVGDSLDPPLLEIFCAPLDAYQRKHPNQYELALRAATDAVPIPRILKPRNLAWPEKLFDEEGSLHYFYYQMYWDLKAAVINAISSLMATVGSSQTVSSVLEMLLFEENGVPRFRPMNSETPSTGREARFELDIDTGHTGEPAHLKIRRKLKLLRSDAETLLYREVVGLFGRLSWLVKNYNEQHSAAGWLWHGETVTLAGTGVTIKLP